MPANVQVLVVGDGRSMFKNTIHLPVHNVSKVDEDESFSKVADVMKDQKCMDEMRLCMLCHQLWFEQTAQQYQIPDDVSTHA